LQSKSGIKSRDEEADGGYDECGRGCSASDAGPQQPFDGADPAYNEAGSIEDTIRSMQNQTLRRKRSSSLTIFHPMTTGERARRLGVIVLRPPQTPARRPERRITVCTACGPNSIRMAVDADTILAPDAIEKLMAALDFAGTSRAALRFCAAALRPHDLGARPLHRVPVRVSAFSSRWPGLYMIVR